MATLPSRRDSNRTTGDMIRLLAPLAKKQGLIEQEFIAQFNPKYAELARKIYREVL